MMTALPDAMPPTALALCWKTCDQDIGRLCEGVVTDPINST